MASTSLTGILRRITGTQHPLLHQYTLIDISSYSYVDTAAENGYTTFSYDRLGIGLSEHPDPIQVVQSELEVGIAHSLTQSLRAGDFSSTKFAHVVGVGHSFGSIINVGQTAQFPKDLDAVVLTGFGTSTSAVSSFMAGLNAAIARENQPSRFPNLNNGYIISDTQISNQFDFFRLPNYPSANLVLAEATKQTLTFGELFTLGQVAMPATAFTGPIDVVDGENDWPFCQGNCNLPTDQAAAVKAILYPAASAGSQSYIAKGAGHALNFHYSATAAFQQIQSFVEMNGL